MNLPCAVDALLLDRVYQVIVNRTQARTPFALSSMCYGVYFGLVIALAFYHYLVGTPAAVRWSLGCQGSVAAFLYFRGLRASHHMPLRPNPLRLAPLLIAIRLMTIVLMLFFVSIPLLFVPELRSPREWLFDSGWFAYICALYFEACDPPAPKPEMKENEFTATPTATVA